MTKTLNNYKGFTNRPTCEVWHWIHADKAELDCWLDACEDLQSDPKQLANYMQSRIAFEYDKEGLLEEALTKWALSLVNWRELAERLLKEYEDCNELDITGLRRWE
jgi:hypothetical protein